MLGIIAAVLIVLWMLGYFAFHVTAAFIHVILVVGLILLVLHLVRRAYGAFDSNYFFSPHYGMSNRSGRIAIPKVPDGRYQLNV